MKMLDLKTNSHERIMLENKALASICACYYYDLADNINTITDQELVCLITSLNKQCENCDTNDID